MEKNEKLFGDLVLNQQQLKVITAPMEVDFVVAGPGTGKTRVLCLRIAYLINNFGIKPEQILAIVFSRKAATEIDRRIKKILPETNFTWINTIHAFCKTFLKTEIWALHRSNSFVILDDRERTNFINRLVNENNFDLGMINSNQLSELIHIQKINKVSVNVALDHIEWASDNINVRNEATKIADRVSQLYHNFLVENNRLDFDDLLILTHKILTEFPKIKEKWQDLFEYILVDEFQDIDQIQYEIIRLLAQKKKHLFVVGDPDQSIYSWRGTIPNIDQKFKNDFTDAKVCVLNQSYRSSEDILNVANALIQNNPNRINKKLFTERTSTNPVVAYSASSQLDEANWIADRIDYLVNKVRVFQFNDIAILYRNTFWADSIKEELTCRGFPTSENHLNDLYELDEIRDLIAYIKCLLDQDNDSILRIIDKPNRNISQNALRLIKNFAHDHLISIYDALVKRDEINGLDDQAKEGITNFLIQLETIQMGSNLECDKIIDTILKVTNYTQILTENASLYLENIKEFSNKLISFQRRHTFNALRDFIKTISISNENKQDHSNTIKLLTIHAAKGLEFPCVFVTGLVERVLPDWRSLVASKGSLNLIEEERRLFYVAITRAKDQLYLTSCQGVDPKTNARLYPSSFMNEIPQKLLLLVKAPAPPEQEIRVVTPLFPKGINFENKSPKTQDVMLKRLLTMFLSLGVIVFVILIFYFLF